MEIVVAALIGLATGHVFDLFFPSVYTDQPLAGRLARCPACESPFRPAFALPVAGYAVHIGRCPDCGARLPLRGLVLPAGGSAMFVASYSVFDSLGPALLGGFFGTVFLMLTLTDLERRLLPNRIVYPSLLLAMALSWGWPHNSVVDVFIGGGVGVVIALALFLFSLPFGGGAFGMGDVKMIVLIGFVVGIPSVVVGAFVGTLAAGAASAFLVLTRIRTMKDYIPHGPFLALGAVVALFWGEDIWDWYRG
jgi:prepilin signal peptidase PulO-like enzyme (type II secretory pathway)